jgi:glycosyltransferase involved in cell wall biosynthesis
MKVALIARSTLYNAPGGDTVQIIKTAAGLNALGVTANIKLSREAIDYQAYDLLHFFNITRPADILSHVKLSGKPYVVSTIFCDYSEYDKNHRKGMAGLFAYLSGDTIEYVKTIARWALGKDQLTSLSYFWQGQSRSIRSIINGAAFLLPNSSSEYSRIIKKYPSLPAYRIIPNGVDPELFKKDECVEKDDHLVLCVARIEGIKNQFNLIKALNNTRFKLLIIGTHAPNQHRYYQRCREIAGTNIEFIGHLPQTELLKYYRYAKVHVLPSWFETTGLSTLEAAVMGCNVVITNKGDTRDYFEDLAYYCDPESPQSIYRAIEQASQDPNTHQLREKILNNYTWEKAAIQTFKAYQTTLS